MITVLIDIDRTAFYYFICVCGGGGCIVQYMCLSCSINIVTIRVNKIKLYILLMNLANRIDDS